MISSGVMLRSSRGLSIIERKPEFEVGRDEVAPTLDIKERIFGFFGDDFGDLALVFDHRGEGSIWRAFGVGGDLPDVAARMNSWGRGRTAQTVSTTVAPKPIITARGRAMARRSVRS